MKKPIEFDGLFLFITTKRIHCVYYKQNHIIGLKES